MHFMSGFVFSVMAGWITELLFMLLFANIVAEHNLVQSVLAYGLCTN